MEIKKWPKVTSNIAKLWVMSPIKNSINTSIDISENQTVCNRLQDFI